MNRNTAIMITGLLLTGSMLGAANATDPATTPQASPQANQGQQQLPWLGVAIESIPPSVSAHLLANVPSGQGVMVTRVDPGSPAHGAGLQAYDILLSYGGQKLFAPQQLTALVRADNVGKEVDLEYVHQGEVMSTKAILASQARAYAPAQGPRGMPAFPQWGSRMPNFNPMPMMPNRPPQLGEGQPQGQPGGKALSNFNAYTISQINGKYSVETSYLDKDGVEKSTSYKGNRDEIMKLIEADQDLPDAQRAQLLNALNMQNAMPMPDMRNMMRDFQHPFFQRPQFYNGWGR